MGENAIQNRTKQDEIGNLIILLNIARSSIIIIYYFDCVCSDEDAERKSINRIISNKNEMLEGIDNLSSV